MQRRELNDLLWFLAVAEERSFTRAAAKLGTSQSTLSATIKQLEQRLGERERPQPSQMEGRTREAHARGRASNSVRVSDTGLF